MNTRNRITLLIVVLLLAAVLPGVKAQGAPFKVAAVAPSAKNDLAFSQSMYAALVAVQAEMGEDNFQFDFQEGTFVVDDAAAAARDWASSGEYDLVILHGSQFGSVVEELAPEFPEVSFAWGTKGTFREDARSHTARNDIPPAYCPREIFWERTHPAWGHG